MFITHEVLYLINNKNKKRKLKMEVSNNILGIYLGVLATSFIGFSMYIAAEILVHYIK
jgi:hypothetical protein